MSQVQLLDKDVMDTQRDVASIHHVDQDYSQESEYNFSQPAHDYLFPWAHDETSNDDNVSVGGPAQSVSDPENLTIASIIDQGILCRLFIFCFAFGRQWISGFLTENGWISKTIEDEAAQRVWDLADNPPNQWLPATSHGGMIRFEVCFTSGWIRASSEWSEPIYALQSGARPINSLPSGTTRPLKLWVAEVVEMQQEFRNIYKSKGRTYEDEVENLTNNLKHLILLAVASEEAMQSRNKFEMQREAAKILSQLAVFFGGAQEFEGDEDEFTLAMMLKWYFTLEERKREIRCLAQRVLREMEASHPLQMTHY